jgi:hypothetical protein
METEIVVAEETTATQVGMLSNLDVEVVEVRVEADVAMIVVVEGLFLRVLSLKPCINSNWFLVVEAIIAVVGGLFIYLL